MGSGNTKKITATLFYIRVCFDLFVIAACILVMWWKMRIGYGQAFHFALPVLVTEPFIYCYSVRMAYRKVNIQRKSDM
jgi:hypothetical protein